jgi:hypothetical protein
MHLYLLLTLGHLGYLVHCSGQCRRYIGHLLITRLLLADLVVLLLPLGHAAVHVLRRLVEVSKGVGTEDVVTWEIKLVS